MSRKIITFSLMCMLIAAITITAWYWLERVQIIPTNFMVRFVSTVFTRGNTVPVAAQSVYNDSLLLDTIRLEKKEEQLQALQIELTRQEQLLEERRNELIVAEASILKTITELEEQKKTVNQNQNSFENKSEKVQQVATTLVNMPPEDAVKILNTFDDDLLIDVLLSVDELAASRGTVSVVPYWLSLMAPERAGVLQQKLVYSR